MNTQIGTIAKWNKEKGFGFIHPKSGGKEIFVHITDYSRTHKIPCKGIEVEYLVSKDQKGRRCAVEIRPLNGHKKNSRETRQKTLSILIFAGFASVIYILFNSRLIPLALIGLYAGMNVIAFALYAKDKSAAEWGTWRTPENTLHTISLLAWCCSCPEFFAT